MYFMKKNNLIQLNLQDNLAIIFMNNPPNNLINNQFLDSCKKIFMMLRRKEQGHY